MIKKLTLIIIMFLNVIYFVFSQKLEYKIIEKTGSVDIRFEISDWKQAKVDQEIPYYAEIITGFHSQVTIEITNGSYITINQLSHIKINEQKEIYECCITNITLLRGYVLAHAKRISNEKNRIIINMQNGTAEFNESSGEVYLREDKGAFIKAYDGKVKILTKKKTPILNLKKEEICCFLPNGGFLDSDYFLRRNINVKPNNLTETNSITAYYDQLFHYYSNDQKSNDYANQFKP